MIPTEARNRSSRCLLGPRGYLDRPKTSRSTNTTAAWTRRARTWWSFRAPPKTWWRSSRSPHEYDIPIVGRGAGTGLSGGAIPRAGGIIDRLRPHEPHPRNRSARTSAPWCSPASSTSTSRWPCRTEVLLRARPFQPARLHHRRQRRRERRRPAHAGLWRHDQSRARPRSWSCPMAPSLSTGGKATDLPGYDLTGLLTGSEGTMALVTKVIVRLMRQPGGGEDDARHLRSHRRLRPTPSRKSPRARSRRSPSRCWTASCCAWWRRPRTPAIPWTPPQCC